MTASVKKQLARTLTTMVDGRAFDALQRQGQALPCSVTGVNGAVVTVAFEVASEFTLPTVTCPIAESFYVRLPIQVGDRGYVIPARARMGGVSGLGSGLAPLVAPSNLGGLVFHPVGNATWATIDPNAVVINAPNGSVIRTIGGESVITLDTGKITVVQDGVTVDIEGGNITVNAPNNVTITCPQSTINGNVTINGDTLIDGNLSLTGDFTATGATFNITAPAMTIESAVAITGSLSINGKDFTTHEHVAQGSLRAGSTVITGNTGTLV
jgi:phage baseplate assembly protein gpV